MATHGQRTLAGYSPWGHKESDMTEYTCTHTLSKIFGDISEDILFWPSHFCSTYPENARYYVLELAI